ncbi:MAG: anaerobic sulfatase maturase [Methylotenera sp.]|nr:anaerobic sulfatase maturase [Methylotenera sp.]MDD4927253.1 anaerobic sulfatase maturase [Methylotenera sp.]
MAKPAGPVCNLDCTYCFYLEKEHLYPKNNRFLMSDELLRTYIEQNIEREANPEVVFTWQGGEPMLRGLDFYQRAFAYQQALAGGKTIRNALQTNGTLLDEAWCEFLAKAGFTVGISLDGPKEIHDADRVDKQGRPTFDAVMRGIELLKKYQIEFNVLVTVTNNVAQHPKQVYQFLKHQNITHVQFNPVVERMPNHQEQTIGLTFAQPGKVSLSRQAVQVTPHSVAPAAYGEFLNAIFDEWVRNDVGKVFVMNFEWALASFMRLPSTVCLFAENCGKALILEHNGDVYSCDHFVYPEYLLGNLQDNSVTEMANSAQQVAFGHAKSKDLPNFCKQCEYLFACHGECPKNRFSQTPDGEANLNYLCPSYKSYFKHITQYMNAMAKLISHGQPAALIMDAFNGPLMVKLAERH